jgi:hypothetical protein
MEMLILSLAAAAVGAGVAIFVLSRDIDKLQNKNTALMQGMGAIAKRTTDDVTRNAIGSILSATDDC